MIESLEKDVDNMKQKFVNVSYLMSMAEEIKKIINNYVIRDLI